MRHSFFLVTAEKPRGSHCSTNSIKHPHRAFTSPHAPISLIVVATPCRYMILAPKLPHLRNLSLFAQLRNGTPYLIPMLEFRIRKPLKIPWQPSFYRNKLQGNFLRCLTNSFLVTAHAISCIMVASVIFFVQRVFIYIYIYFFNLTMVCTQWFGVVSFASAKWFPPQSSNTCTCYPSFFSSFGLNYILKCWLFHSVPHLVSPLLISCTPTLSVMSLLLGTFEKNK